MFKRVTCKECGVEFVLEGADCSVPVQHCETCRRESQAWLPPQQFVPPQEPTYRPPAKSAQIRCVHGRLPHEWCDGCESET